MRKDIERQIGTLADRISALEHKYTSTEIRSLDFVIDTLSQWATLRNLISDSHREVRRAVTVRHNGVLYNISTDFVRGMNMLMESYDREHIPTTEFIQQTYDRVRKGLKLFRQAGLHVNGHLQKTGIDVDQKYSAYAAFEQRLQQDLAMLPKSIPKADIFDETVSVLSLAFPIALIETDDGTVNWSYASPDSLCRPTGKNVRDFNRPDMALVLADAYIRRMNVLGERLNIDPATLSGMLLKSHQSAILVGNRQNAIDAMQSKVLDYRRGNGSYGK